MATGTFPVVKGKRLRATKINSCGRPEAGTTNRLVTSGFVSFNITPVMNDAEELEQKNAEGKVCVTDRTPPERKWYTIEAVLCNVDTALITMFTGWEKVVDWNDMPVGFQDQASVDGDYGVALEVWTGGKGEDDCPVPTTDSIFSVSTSGMQYGYLLIGGKEFTLGGIDIGAQVSTFTLTGISVAMPQWGRGPYNVAALDADATPGRMLAPMNEDSHFRLFRTPIAPPEPTDGAVPLNIATKFVDPDFYFGGPASEPAADVAPSQDSSEYDVAVTGTPTAGSYTLKYTDPSGTQRTTGAIAYNALPAAVETALAALDNLEAADVDATGTATSYTVVFQQGGVLALGTASLTGGTSPGVTVTPA